MNDAEIRSGVLAALCRRSRPRSRSTISPPTRPLREQVDLDSMDWLNVILGLHQRFGVDIPEADYARLVTLDAYRRLPRRAAARAVDRQGERRGNRRRVNRPARNR